MKVLHIQHAGALGGSAFSLLYTMEGLQNLGHECVVALVKPANDIRELYVSSGFETISQPLLCWDHSTVAPRPLSNPFYLAELGYIGWNWRKAKRVTKALIEAVNPDVVHLNSAPLAASAAALIEMKFPFVWHVREPPPNQTWRTRFFRRLMMQAPAMVFICEYDRRAWMGCARGHVVQNFVDFARFDSRNNTDDARVEFGVERQDPVFLYLGGFGRAKGWKVFLEALVILHRRGIEFVALMPGTADRPRGSWRTRFAGRILPFVGLKAPYDEFGIIVRRHGLAQFIRRLPFRTDVERLLAASDVLVFPATVPHFARPVIEAAAMSKPSVGSNVGGVNELIEHEFNGLLVPPNDAKGLAEALERLSVDVGLRTQLGVRALTRVRERNGGERQVRTINQILTSVAR